VPRSLKLRPECIPQLKSSLLRHGFPSQRILAEQLSIAQSTVSNFLNGKPVDYVNFVELCQVLGQEWQDLADLGNQSASIVVNHSVTQILIHASFTLVPLAVQLQQALLKLGQTVCSIDTKVPSLEVLKQTNYLLLLLSSESVSSEVLLETVRLVKDGSDSVQKIAILPICIDCPKELFIPFDLASYLQDIQPWQWNSAENSSVLATELLNSVFQTQRFSLPGNHKFAIAWSHFASPLNQNNPLPPPPLPLATPEIPGGQMEVASRFYIERPPIEQRCYEVIAQPGSLIRIKAARQMGKTSLMAKILHHAQQQGSNAIALSLQLANQRVLQNSETFLQWFCASLSWELGLLNEAELAKYWQLASMIGSNQSCKAYLEQFLLPQLSVPLTLGLDEVDRVFTSLEIADDFFGLLRALHEEAKRNSIWKNLRLIVVHSTEVYIPLDVNKSPFNVGLPIELPEFNTAQVQELTQRHQLDWTTAEVESLMTLVGGHPYLVRLALYAIAQQDVKLDQLIHCEATQTKIYSDHLHRHLSNLVRHPALFTAFKSVVLAENLVQLPSEQAFKLSSMGLVNFNGQEAKLRCQLYDRFFKNRISKQSCDD
jgi:hypothetical protein